MYLFSPCTCTIPRWAKERGKGQKERNKGGCGHVGNRQREKKGGGGNVRRKETMERQEMELQPSIVISEKDLKSWLKIAYVFPSYSPLSWLLLITAAGLPASLWAQQWCLISQFLQYLFMTPNRPGGVREGRWWNHPYFTDGKTGTAVIGQLVPEREESARSIAAMSETDPESSKDLQSTQNPYSLWV